MKTKRPNLEQLWIILGILLSMIIATIILSRVITPFLNYVIWGIGE